MPSRAHLVALIVAAAFLVHALDSRSRSYSGVVAAQSASEIVLLAADARLAGGWRVVSDAGAAGGRAAVLPNAGRPKVLAPVASPGDYFELTFDAVANTPYRLWVRGRAQDNHRYNDSVHVQFTGSVDEAGRPAWRIGTTSGAAVNLEDCSGCGNSGWGWEDNGWGSPGALGPEIRFATSGSQTIRVQNREDGFFIDQIVLSASRYLSTAPGANKNDTTILVGGTSSQSASEIVLHTASASPTGAWRLVSDAAAASGVAAVLPNAGRPRLLTASAAPADYFELTFNVVAQTPYRLWMRGRADGDDRTNDSVHVQFTNSVAADGSASWRIGTTSSVVVNLEDCSGCGNSGWGWEDNGWGSPGALGPEIRFATDGPQRLRVQNREDGFFIDQVVLSPSRYLTAAPGANKNDTTILAPTVAPPTTDSVTLVREPYLQQLGDRSAVIVWATAQNGAAAAQINGTTVTAATTRYPASATGMSSDYYQHEAEVHGLSPSTIYPYELRLGGVVAARASLTTAPQTGTGSARFIAFGDSGVGSTAQKSLAARMTADANWDLALHAGDVAYGAATTGGDATYQTYHSWFFDIYRGWLPRRPFFPSLGNHDARASNGHGTAYLNLFVLPRNGATGSYPDHAERFYSFDHGPVHFVALDTELAFQDPARRDAQLAWLAADLSASAQPWKVVFFHRSPYSAGAVHGSDLAVRQAFGPLLERHGVQLALSSHEHVYERTVPIRRSTNTAYQAVTYIVTGGGGGKLYASGGNWWTAYATSNHHYVRLRASGCVLTTVAVNTSGGTFDAYTLDRCAQASDAGPPTVRIAAPANGATVSGIVTVSVTAADDVRVEKVDLLVDGVWRLKDRSAPYSFSWDSRSVPPGSHRLEARVYDIAGNQTSATITITSTGS